MNHQIAENGISQTSLKPRFFGKVTASVSHEIQNVMAIVKENAGLMEDLIQMAMQSEQDIPVERLVRCLSTIKKQATRGTGLTSNLNGFAHTTDHPILKVDIVDLTRRLIDLTGRLAENVGVQVTIGSNNAPALMTTDPVQFQAAIHLILESLFMTVSSGTVIILDFPPKHAEGEVGRVSITATFPSSDTPDLSQVLPKASSWSTLIDALSAIHGKATVSASEILITF